MKRVENKLRGRSGATILFAILVFMLCILAGTGALTAAAANSGRYTHLKEDQKQYLSMSSAVKLLRGELSGKTFTAKAKVTDVTTTGAAPTRTVEWSDSTNHIEYESGLKDLLKTQLEELFRYGVYETLGTSIVITPGTDFNKPTTKPTEQPKTYIIDAGGNMYKVTAKMTVGPTETTGTPSTDLLDKDFCITIEFSFGTATNYATTLKLLATFADGAGKNGLKSNQISKTTVTDTTGGTTVTTVTTVTEYTLEVRWLEENTHVAAATEPSSGAGG